jgi:hypothetical protein
MATWQGVNINTGTVELPKYNAEGVFEEIYIAAVGTTLASGDVILGPIVQAGLFVTNVKAAVDKLDSASSGAFTFEVGYINSGTTTAAAFIATGNTTGQAGGIASANVPASYGQTFTNNVTIVATITNAAGTAVAGNFRLGVSSTASP